MKHRLQKKGEKGRAESLFGFGVIGVNSRLLSGWGLGRTDWESQGSKFQQNAHICPYIKQNLTSSGTPLTISSNSLLANCRFKQHHILSLMPGTKIPHELKDGGIFRASALSRLHTCAVQKRCFSYQPPPHTHTSLVSHPYTRTGYNKLQLKFLCCWSWPLSCSPNEVFWCAPKIHSLLFSILFAVSALTGGLTKNVSFHAMPPLGANCSFLP